MKTAIHCPECGSLTRTDLFKGRLEGLCPKCLAAIAVEDELKADPAPALNVDVRDRLGKFGLAEKLGAGSAGEVWKAWDAALGRWVALKVFHQDDPQELLRFRREAQTAARLSHPNIAAVYEVGEEAGRHYLAMQFVDGVTLQKVPRRDRRLLVRLVRDAARAVGAAHASGIIHRDLKPANLMVTRRHKDRADEHLYVLDFGLARQISGSESVTASGIVVGTPAFMPPEQARGEAVDGRADVYALGATLYQLLTGRPLFRGANVYEILRKVEELEPRRPRAFDSGIHKQLEAVVLKCLEKDRGRRYRTAEDLADDLDRYLQGEPVLAKPAGVVRRFRSVLAKRKWMGVAVGALLALAGASAVILPKWRSDATARTLLEDRRERFERARPHVETGKSILQRMRLRMREDYTPEDLGVLAGEARAAFEQALKTAPDHPEAYTGIGVSFSRVGNKPAALDAFAKAIEADPRFAPAYLERVRLTIEDYEKLRHAWDGTVVPETSAAIDIRLNLEADLRQVERYSHDYPHQIYAKGLLAFAQGQYATAVGELGKYTEAEPEDSSGHYWVGHAYFHLERRAEALASFSRALKFDVRYASALERRASVLHALERIDEEIADLTQLLERDPDNGPLLRQRGDAYQALNLLDKAIADYSKVIETNPKAPLSHVGRGNARFRKGQIDDAIADWTKAIELQPRGPKAHYNRGVARMAKGQFEAAVQDFTEAVDIDPKHASAYYNRGIAHGKLGLNQKAIEDYDRAIELSPTLAEAITNRGLLKCDMGRVDEGMVDFERALDVKPTLYEAHRGLGRAKIFKGVLDEAIRHLNKAIELAPERPITFLDRGVAFYDQKEYARAVADFTKAVQLDSGNPQAFFNLGNALLASERFEEAVESYTRALTLGPLSPDALHCRGMARNGLGRHEEALTDYQDALRVAGVAWRHRATVESLLVTPEAIPLYQEGIRLYWRGRYRESIARFSRIPEQWPTTQPAILACYYSACGHALLGEKPSALDWLEKGVLHGMKEAAWIEGTSDFTSLRGEDRFLKLLEKLKQK